MRTGFYLREGARDSGNIRRADLILLCFDCFGGSGVTHAVHIAANCACLGQRGLKLYDFEPAVTRMHHRVCTISIPSRSGRSTAGLEDDAGPVQALAVNPASNRPMQAANVIAR